MLALQAGKIFLSLILGHPVEPRPLAPDHGAAEGVEQPGEPALVIGLQLDREIEPAMVVLAIAGAPGFLAADRRRIGKAEQE